MKIELQGAPFLAGGFNRGVLEAKALI